MSSRTVFNGRIRGATVYGRRAWPDCFLEFVIVALTPACVRVPLTSLKVLHSKQNTFIFGSLLVWRNYCWVWGVNIWMQNPRYVPSQNPMRLCLYQDKQPLLVAWMRHYTIMSGVQMTGVIRVLEVVEPSNRLFPTSCFWAFGIYSLVVVGHRLMWHEPHNLLDRFQKRFKLFIYTNKGGIFFFIRNNKNKGPSALIRMPCLNLVLCSLSRSWPPTFIPSLAQPITIIEVFSRHERLVLGELF